MDEANVLKKKVILRAPVLSQSGYGVHSRQIARWLLSRQDVDLVVHPVQWGMTPWLLDHRTQDGLIGQIMEKARDDKGPFDVSFQVQLPNEWDPKLAAVNVGVSAGVETTICNPEWVKCVNQMSHVVFPSSFVRTAFDHAGTITNANVHVIPEAYIDVIGSAPPLDLELSTSFNFLLVGQLTSRSAESDRKNIFNTIKWFCESFADDPDVGLIIKTNNGRDSKIDRKVTIDTMKQVISQVKKGEFPRIHLIHGMLTDDEMAGLYRHPSVKAFVSLTRGEGFGLPILEAAVAGLPVIATNWSGHLDYLKHGKFIKLDFELHQVPKSRIDSNIFMPEAKWADVNEHDVKRKLKRFRERPEIPREWAQALASTLAPKYSFAAVSKHYDELWSKLSAW